MKMALGISYIMVLLGLNMTVFADDKKLDIKTMGPGLHKMEVVHSDGLMQRYTISIPDSYDGKTAMPMILGLHYGYDREPNKPTRPTAYYGNEFYGKIYQDSFHSLNAIFVAPDSINGAWSTPENEAAVLTLMDGILDSYNIDAKKTVVTGFSMGAFGTWHMASNHQDRFVAAIPIAGIPADMRSFRQDMEFFDVDWHIPLYVMHSRVDEVVPFEPTETYVKQIKAEGKDVTFHIIDDLSHHETTKYAEPARAMVPWIENVWQNVK